MKNIVLRDTLYQELNSIKKEKESFSDVITRLLETGKDNSYVLKKYAGTLKNTELFDLVMEDRRQFQVRQCDL